MFDGGLFVVLNVLALVFLLPKFGIPFKLISIVTFFAIGTILLAGEDVAFTWSGTEAVSTGSAATTVDVEQTFYIIGDGDPATFNDNETWVGWIYIALGALSSFSFLGRYISTGGGD